VENSVLQNNWVDYTEDILGGVHGGVVIHGGDVLMDVILGDLTDILGDIQVQSMFNSLERVMTERCEPSSDSQNSI